MNKFVVYFCVILVAVISFFGGIKITKLVDDYYEVQQKNEELAKELQMCADALAAAKQEIASRGEIVYQHTECEEQEAKP